MVFFLVCLVWRILLIFIWKVFSEHLEKEGWKNTFWKWNQGENKSKLKHFLCEFDLIFLSERDEKVHLYTQIFRTKFLNQPSNLKTIETINLFLSGKCECINVKKFRNKQICDMQRTKGYTALLDREAKWKVTEQGNRVFTE